MFLLILIPGMIFWSAPCCILTTQLHGCQFHPTNRSLRNLQKQIRLQFRNKQRLYLIANKKFRLNASIFHTSIICNLPVCVCAASDVLTTAMLVLPQLPQSPPWCIRQAGWRTSHGCDLLGEVCRDANMITLLSLQHRDRPLESADWTERVRSCCRGSPALLY